jgi:hypothetical protein
MSTKVLALILLVGHLTSVGLISRVLWRQLKIMLTKPDPELREGRRVMLILALTGLSGNFVPITVDVLVLVSIVQRHPPNLVGVAYALSNVITLIIISSAINTLYIVAEKLLRKTTS